jgi:Ferritin-like
MTSPTKAGRGALAQVIATRGGLAAPEAPFVIEHREALIYMLCQAAELEHALMCQYLYAAFSLKQSTEERLTKTELARVERWRTTIANIATQEMLHLALVQNVLSAIGAAPHLTRPNLPHPAGHYPPGVVLTLLPFGDAALRHFMFLERPEGMDLGDADGLAATERCAPQMEEGEIVPRLQDFATVGHLYRSIEEGIKHLSSKYGERCLFVGPPSAQANRDHFGWPALVAVVDAASAQRAIDTIVEQGEGPRGHWRKAHFGRFVEILDEFDELRKSNPRFDPVRPVLPATVRPREGDRVTPLIEDPLTAKCVDLFNVSYEVLLQTLGRYFAHTEESSSELATLANLAVGLMFQVIKPLGNLITTLPVGPSYPDRTAGPSFELFYESDYFFPHRDAAWILLEERLREAAAFCDRIRNEAPVDVGSRLEPIGSSVLSLAQSLAEVRAAWGLTGHAGEVTVAHRRQDAQAARGTSDIENKLERLKEEERMNLPDEGEAVSFAAHIKGLFRERDRQSMKFAFDLWSYEDVKAHAQPIVERLRAGTMPCDGAWTVEKIDAFQRWIDGGMTA